MKRLTNEKSVEKLRRMLYDVGFSENAAAELLKWYDTSKKGVASF